VSEEERVRRRHTRQENRALRFWRSYRLELILLVAVALGLFLVLERMSLRATLAAWFRGFITRLLGRFQALDAELTAFLARLSISDVVGFVLIVGAVAAILLRVRWRLLNDPRLTAPACPRCGGPIHRVHRTRLDHLISIYVPVRRYRCHNEACHWQGRRVGKHHHSTPRRSAQPGVE
jgi:hypothetical protein